MRAIDPNSVTNTTVVRKPKRQKIPAVSSDSWNNVAAHIEKNRITMVHAKPMFLHPWSVIFARLPEKTISDEMLRRSPLNYSAKTIKEIAKEPDEKLRWHFQFIPGFVNGTPVRIHTKACSASENSRKRIRLEREAAGIKGDKATPKDDEIIDVPITEFPYIALADAGAVRKVGFTGNPVEDAMIFFGGTPEQVPEPFLALGCKQVTSTVELQGTQIQVDETGEKDIPAEDVRLVRAADVVLKVERASLKYDIVKGNALIDGYTQLVVPRYGRNSAKNKYAELRIQAGEFTPIPPMTMEGLLAGLPSDPEYDELKIATIYFISPFGTSYGPQEDVPITGSWQIEVKYETFWNVCYCPAEIPPIVPPAPLVLIIPLLSGIANFIINTILAPINDAMSLFMATQRNKPLVGKFWST